MSSPLDTAAVLAFILAWIEKEQSLPDASLQADAEFEDLGLDSLARMTLAGEIFDTFGCEFEASIMWDCKSPTQVVEALAGEALEHQAAEITITTLSEGSAPHVVLFFGLGGTARDLFPLADGLRRSGEFSISALEQPFSDEAKVHNAEDTIAAIASALHKRFGAEPVIPFGYSFGGLLAMGVADALRAKGGQAPFVGLLDTSHPSAGRQSVSNSRRLATLVRHFPGWLTETVLLAAPGERRQGLRAIRREFRHLSSALRGERRPTMQEVVATKGRPPAWDARTEQNFHALADYTPESHSGDLIILRARTRPLDGGQSQPKNGWSSVVKGQIQVIPLPGTHATILSPKRLQEAGALLAASIRSQRRERSQNCSA